MHHLMLDFETLGTNPDSVVLSLGAVLFTLERGVIDDFYVEFEIQEQLRTGRKVTADTIIWWMSQNENAQKVFKGSDRESVKKMSAFMDRLLMPVDKKKLMVWSNGANFDVVIYEHILTSLNKKPPWMFWNVRCFRTWKALLNIRTKKGAVKHNALEDATDQANLMINHHQKRKRS